MIAPPNLPLLRKILDHIDAHPDEWVQEQFGIRGDHTFTFHDRAPSACGTAYCLAGHAAVMTGHKLAWEIVGARKLDVASYTTDGQAIHDVARHELGLTDEEAENLFGGTNDRRDIQAFAEMIADRAGEPL